MFNLEEIHKIEIELTTRCQAACPMCSRNFHGLMPNGNFKNIDWTVSQFKQIITLEVLKYVKVISLCGAYGDPLICKDLIDICSYIKEHSNAEIRINTNGSLHNTRWWTKLAKVLPAHMVIFGIDGFKENHEKHRIGTDFDKIIKNATAFIAAGGTAVAQFINFEHNKNDYDELRTFLLNIGFQSIYKVNSNRFKQDSYVVFDKNQKELYRLLPSNEEVVAITDADIPTIIENNENITVKCRSISQKEIYIDARKHLYPCCETADIRYEIERYDEPNFNLLLPKLKNQITQIHQEYSSLDYIDLTKVSIKQVLEDPNYLKTWQKYWDLKQSVTCNVTCGQLNNKRIINRDSQFVF